MTDLVSREFLDIDHFRECLRGRDTPAIQLEPGKLRIQLHSLNMGDVIFSDTRVNRKAIDHSRITDGWHGFVVNLSHAIFCGREIESGNMTILSSKREYRSILTGDWRSIEIIVSSDLLAHEGLSLPLHLISDPETATYPLPAELVGIFRQLARTAFGGSQERDIESGSLRRALLRALGKALAIADRYTMPASIKSRADGYDLAKRTVRHIESQYGKRITVSDLAQELGVTPRALNYAARSVFDMSPFELVRAFRLNHVRHELWERRFSQTRVTSAALMQDFGHLGRFSQQYKSLFGELPSQTLERIRLLS